jgi:methyltransferase (TIGR00027 family)
MQKSKASETAIACAIVRAVHQTLDHEPKILEDPLSVGLVEGSSEQEIRERAEEFGESVWRYSRSEVLYRNRFAEDELRSSVRDGVSQYLLLSAGLDTFAYRQPEWASDLSIVEVDHPATQDLKRSCLDRLSVESPSNVTFCAIDFDDSTLAEGLRDSSFDPDVPTYVSWLGVTPYLPRQTVEDVFKFVLSLPPLSRITFTFYLPTASLDGIDLEWMEWLEAYVSERGEPFYAESRMEADQMLEWLQGLGFSSVRHLTPQDQNEAYFAGRTDGLPSTAAGQAMCAHV